MCVANCFYCAQLYLVSQSSILSIYYLCVNAYMCTRLFPVVQTWVLDVSDRPVSMQTFCVGQDVLPQQMHSGLGRHCACNEPVSLHFSVKGSCIVPDVHGNVSPIKEVIEILLSSCSCVAFNACSQILCYFSLTCLYVSVPT